MTDSLPPELRDELKRSLVDTIEEFFEGNLAAGAADPVADQQLQLATAVLLLEVARCDFDTRSDEFQAVTKAVRDVLGIDDEAAETVVRVAEEEVRESRRLYRFTELIDQKYSAEEKKLVVQYLWQVSFADAQLLASEEYIVRKIADLLHVPLADFLAAKIAARDAFR